jgi:hypothetical protein
MASSTVDRRSGGAEPLELNRHALRGRVRFAFGRLEVDEHVGVRGRVEVDPHRLRPDASTTHDAERADGNGEGPRPPQ